MIRGSGNSNKKKEDKQGQIENSLAESTIAMYVNSYLHVEEKRERQLLFDEERA